MSSKAPDAYLNMAGAGPVSDDVLAATGTYLKIEQQVGAYDTELDHEADLDDRVYRNLARLMGCGKRDVAIFDNATRAWIEVVSRVDLGAAKRIFTTPYEYAGNLQYLKDLAARHELDLVCIPCDAEGDLDLDWLRANMGHDVGLVSVVHVPSCCGIINPVEDIGQVVQGTSAVYIVDACQAVGQVPIDIEAIGCDALTGAGRKFLCGPRGTGFAYVSPALREKLRPGFVDLHLSDIQESGQVHKDTETARFLETAERNCGALMGLSLAVEEALSGEGRRVDGITRIRQDLPRLPGVVPIDPGRTRGSIFSFRHRDIPAAEIVSYLRQAGIAAWKIKGSHTPLYMLPAGHLEGVRLSSNKLTPEQAQKVVTALTALFSRVPETAPQ